MKNVVQLGARHLSGLVKGAAKEAAEHLSTVSKEKVRTFSAASKELASTASKEISMASAKINTAGKEKLTKGAKAAGTAVIGLAGAAALSATGHASVKSYQHDNRVSVALEDYKTSLPSELQSQVRADEKAKRQKFIDLSASDNESLYGQMDIISDSKPIVNHQNVAETETQEQYDQRVAKAMIADQLIVGMKDKTSPETILHKGKVRIQATVDSTVKKNMDSINGPKAEAKGKASVLDAASGIANSSDDQSMKKAINAAHVVVDLAEGKVTAVAPIISEVVGQTVGRASQAVFEEIASDVRNDLESSTIEQMQNDLKGKIPIAMEKAQDKVLEYKAAQLEELDREKTTKMEQLKEEVRKKIAKEVAEAESLETSNNKQIPVQPQNKKSASTIEDLANSFEKQGIHDVDKLVALKRQQSEMAINDEVKEFEENLRKKTGLTSEAVDVVDEHTAEELTVKAGAKLAPILNNAAKQTASQVMTKVRAASIPPVLRNFGNKMGMNLGTQNLAMLARAAGIGRALTGLGMEALASGKKGQPTNSTPLNTQQPGVGQKPSTERS